MIHDHMMVARSMFDAALITGSNAERFQRLSTTLMGALQHVWEVQIQAGSQALHDHMTHFSRTPGDRNPLHRYAEWASLTQTNQQLTYDALKRSVEIFASAQQAAAELITECARANSTAAVSGNIAMLGPIIERRASSVVIQFPDRRGTSAGTASVSDAEVQMSAVIVS